MKSNIPKDYEYTGLKKSGHCIIRCTKKLLIGDEEVQCFHMIRNTQNPKPHVCYAKKTEITEDTKVDIKKISPNLSVMQIWG